MTVKENRVPGFELWMVSDLAAGAAMSAFLTLLVPPFINAMTGSAARAGIVLALVGLCAVSGPLWGKLADKYKLHKLIYLLSLLGMVMAFAILSFDSIINWYSPIFGVLLGVSLAAQGTIGPVFIIGAGLKPKEVAAQLTVSNIFYPLGQVIGGIVIAIGQFLLLGSSTMFLLAAAVLLVFFVITYFTISPANKRLEAFILIDNKSNSDVMQSAGKQRTKSILFSGFGIFLLVVIFSSMSNNGMTSQIANILPQVYGFSNTATSLLISLAGILNIMFILLTGKWMSKIGATKIYVIGTVTRLAGIAAMALVGFLGQGYLLLAAIAMQIAFQGSAISRLPAPEVAAELSPGSAGEANGFYYGASALGAFIGCLAVGFSADWFGFNTVNIVATIFAVAAVAFIYFMLKTIVKEKK